MNLNRYLCIYADIPVIYTYSINKLYRHRFGIIPGIKKTFVFVDTIVCIHKDESLYFRVTTLFADIKNQPLCLIIQ